ncbi:hypothetical protein T01_6527 [Trichinella spiralis]|uniref:Uncharacterized protein n=1 Tax=Trichinella spiralis TaxID=6334 RepID=A0A0V1BZW2_TRISP|nr:hypothetical protein T01_6527 [Trichinella spiralis]
MHGSFAVETLKASLQTISYIYINSKMHFSDVPRQKDKNPNSNRLLWNDFEEQWTINNIAINFG